MWYNWCIRERKDLVLLEKSHLVTQANRIIEARHKHPLSAREQKIILTMVSMIQPSDEDFSTYDISIREFHEMLGLEGREKYTELKGIVEDLMSKVIEIPKEDGDWLLTHWVSVAKYVSGEGIIQLKFVPELKDYLLQLKRAFTSYRLSNILSLRSAYSIRLYELMKKWQHLGKWECSVDDLKGRLGVRPKTYDRYNHFKERVIKSSVKELNEKTDIQVEFKEIKKGRKVVKIEFSIKHDKEKEITIDKPKKDEFDQVLFDDLSDLTDFELSLSGFKRIEGIAKNIYTKEDNYIEQLELLVELANHKFKQGNIDNPVGFMIRHIEEKEGLAEQGYDAKIEQTSSEVVPDWFREQKREQRRKKREKNK